MLIYLNVFLFKKQSNQKPQPGPIKSTQNQIVPRGTILEVLRRDKKYKVSYNLSHDMNFKNASFNIAKIKTKIIGSVF